jgi:hypothetical protein
MDAAKTKVEAVRCSAMSQISKCFAIQQGSSQFNLICLFQLDILSN